MSSCLVVMGVSGVGKSTVSALLAEELGWILAEGDSFHPAENIAKMAAGTPLTDTDRRPWLAALRDWISEQSEAGRNAVVTCSALKRSYRDILRQADADVRFVHLSAASEEVGPRLAERTGHFMPTSLLESQYAALEPLGDDEPGASVHAIGTPEEITERTVKELGLPA
ncbi:gluconokinase [Salininema proteolyticum]|uniref:Gluconokinase n=1 Tax=Salininema proteolyticum TaxID=1607685 RepID=A0ABV8U3W5_9ACTN